MRLKIVDGGIDIIDPGSDFLHGGTRLQVHGDIVDIGHWVGTSGGALALSVLTWCTQNKTH